MRLFLLSVVMVLAGACGSLGPGRDAGATGGGGGGSATGGGTATGGGVVATGGGIATGGGGTSTGGGIATGGGAATGGGTAVDAGPIPLTWATMGIMNNTSSNAMIGISGELNDVWAVADYSGGVFHSTGGAFNKVASLPGTARGIYAQGGTVVVLQQQQVRVCTANCEAAASYDSVDLTQSNLGWAFSGKAVCGTNKNHIAVIGEKNSGYEAVILEWDGTVWTLVNSSTSLDSAQSCWFDSTGRLNIVGRQGLYVFEGGAGSIVTLGGDSQTSFVGGGDGAGTGFVVGNTSFVSKGTGSAYAEVVIPQTVGGNSFLRSVGGLRPDEVFLLGGYASTNGPGLLWNGTTLKKIGAGVIPSFDDQTTVRGILVTSPTELLLAGGSSNGPIVVRGRR